MGQKYAVHLDLGRSAHTIESQTARWHRPSTDVTRAPPIWPALHIPGPGDTRDADADGREESGPEHARDPHHPGAGPRELSFDEHDIASICADVAVSAQVSATEQLEGACDARVAALAQDLGMAVEQACAERTSDAEATRRQMVQLLRATLEATDAIRAEEDPSEAIVAFVHGCAARLMRPCAISVRVNKDMAQAVEAGLASVSDRLPMDMRLGVEESDELTRDQVRVDWGDGWAELDPGIVTKTVREELHRLEPVLTHGAGRSAPAQELGIDRGNPIETGGTS